MHHIRILAAAAVALTATAASADDFRIALIYGKTGALEAYAKHTETGLRNRALFLEAETARRSRTHAEIGSGMVGGMIAPAYGPDVS